MSQNKIITEHLKVDFTPEELKEKGIALAKTMADIDRLKSEAKAAASAFKSQIDAKTKDSKELANQVNNGYDYFPVQCEARMNDPRPGMKSIYRQDNGDHVETLKMNPEERQLLIDGLADIQQADAPVHISEAIQSSMQALAKEEVLEVSSEDSDLDMQQLQEEDPLMAALEITGPDKPLRNVKIEVVTTSSKKAGKKAKEKPDNIFGTRSAAWFAERIEKEIEAKSPKDFNGVMKIDDQTHADWLCEVAQTERSYSFRDPAPPAVKK